MAEKGKKFGLLNKLAPKRKYNTHISQAYKKGQDGKRNSGSMPGQKDEKGKWAAFKNLFTPISFQSHAEKTGRRRPKQSRDMVMFHHMAAGGKLEDVADVFNEGAREDTPEPIIEDSPDRMDRDYCTYTMFENYKDIEQVEDLRCIWSPATYSTKETDV